MRKPIEGLKINLEGNLELEQVGTLIGGAILFRVSDKENEKCPEYLLGEMALKAGYKYGDKVNYKLIIEPERK